MRNTTTWIFMFFVAAVAALLARPASAYTLVVEWTDGVDSTTVGDVTSARLSFDSSGSWQALWRADPLRPFTGNMRFNLNLTDRDVGSALPATGPQLTLDGFHDFGSGTATSFSYTGMTPYLANWHVGDRVMTSDSFVKAHSSFYSGTVDMNTPTQRDRLVAQAIITQAIPEPETWAMMLAGLGLLGAAAARRGRRTAVA